MASLDFVGKFVCSLDSKKRVNIPSGIRRVFSPEAEDTIVFAPGLEGKNLYANPLTEWKRLTKSLRSLNPFDISASDFIRNFAGEAHNAKMDGQGRILLPDYILKLGQIDNEILIIGAITKLEIWNPEIYKEFRAQQKMSLAEIASQINFNNRVLED